MVLHDESLLIATAALVAAAVDRLDGEGPESVVGQGVPADVGHLQGTVADGVAQAGE